jgi:hypothetical protein
MSISELVWLSIRQYGQTCASAGLVFEKQAFSIVLQ